MPVSMTEVMIVSVIPPDESGGYRITDVIADFPLSERILTQNMRHHQPSNIASRSRQTMASAVGETAPPFARHHAKGINNMTSPITSA